MTTNNLFTSNLEEKIQLYNKIKLLQEKDAPCDKGKETLIKLLERKIQIV